MASIAGARRWLKCDSGAELIEFAVVFPLLFVILAGIAEFGILFQRYEVVTNAAREGARVAVLTGYTTANIQARVNQYITAAGLPNTATTTVGAAQNLQIGGGACVTVRPVTVTYSHQYLFLGPLIAAFNGSINLTAVSNMRSEIAAAGC